MRRLALLFLASACSSPPGAVDAAAGAIDAAPFDAAPNPPDAPVVPPPDGAIAPAPDGGTTTTWPCEPAVVAGHQEVECDEGVRVEVESSAACVAGGCGVILDVHGYTMSADEENAETRMRTLAPPLGFVVVQPTAPSDGFTTTWGTGEHDDVVWSFLEATIDRFAIDPDRVHMMGFSQGGMMTFRMLCAHAEVLASVAPAAGTACFDGTEPAVEVPILYMHGYQDYVIAWSLGASQRDAILAAWDFGPPTVLEETGDYTATRWISGDGTAFEFWEHDFTNFPYVGHCLPGPTDDGGEFRCAGAGQFDWAGEALLFFLSHPRGS